MSEVLSEVAVPEHLTEAVGCKNYGARVYSMLEDKLRELAVEQGVFDDNHKEVKAGTELMQLIIGYGIATSTDSFMLQRDSVRERYRPFLDEAIELLGFPYERLEDMEIPEEDKIEGFIFNRDRVDKFIQFHDFFLEERNLENTLESLVFFHAAKSFVMQCLIKILTEEGLTPFQIFQGLDKASIYGELPIIAETMSSFVLDYDSILIGGLYDKSQLRRALAMTGLNYTHEAWEDSKAFWVSEDNQQVAKRLARKIKDRLEALVRLI